MLTPSPGRPTRLPIVGLAAEYLRMSTEGQQYSIANQQAAIRQYAEDHGFTVVRTYADPGKSGLRLVGRAALIQLLADVQKGNAGFDTILVYDVSRWGRFQDTDESAYYEYLCRRANVRIEYCAEPFQNDGEPLKAIFKNIKRIMAAEYSREQSARVHRATCRVASLGYFTGGWAGYGLRRMLINADGSPNRILAVGEYKAVRADRMTLVQGPPDEIRTVRRIFRLFIEKGMSPQAIADLLNREETRNSHGRIWRSDAVRIVLRNDRYVGTHTYNVYSRKLKKGPRILNDPADWIRVPDAFEAIVSAETFAKAQEVIASRIHKKHTAESLLTRLRYLLDKHGSLSAAIVKADAQPDLVVYQRKLGGLRKAYALIGYRQPRDFVDLARAENVKRITNSVTEQFMDALRAKGAVVSRSWPDGCIVVNDALTVAVKAMPFLPERKRPGWRLYITRKNQPDVTAIIRMDPENAAPQDYFLLPRRLTKRCRVRLGARNYRTYARLRYETPDGLVAAVMLRAIGA